MTLYTLIDKLLTIAKEKPNINFVGEGDIYKLNHIPNIDYSVFYITQGAHNIGENINQYTLNLFYVDRIFEEDNKDNRLLIQSNGIEVITNIVNELVNSEDVDVSYPITYTSFYQRFADDCSGVFATITFTTDSNIGICTYE